MRTLHVCATRMQAQGELAKFLDKGYSISYPAMEARRGDDVHLFREVRQRQDAEGLRGQTFQEIVYHAIPSEDARLFLESRRRL